MFQIKKKFLHFDLYLSHKLQDVFIFSTSLCFILVYLLYIPYICGVFFFFFSQILLCDLCDRGYHTACLRPPLMLIPDGEWFCPPCQHVSSKNDKHFRHLQFLSDDHNQSKDKYTHLRLWMIHRKASSSTVYTCLLVLCGWCLSPAAIGLPPLGVGQSHGNTETERGKQPCIKLYARVPKGNLETN